MVCCISYQLRSVIYLGNPSYFTVFVATGKSLKRVLNCVISAIDIN